MKPFNGKQEKYIEERRRHAEKCRSRDWNLLTGTQKEKEKENQIQSRKRGDKEPEEEENAPQKYCVCILELVHMQIHSHSVVPKCVNVYRSFSIDRLLHDILQRIYTNEFQAHSFPLHPPFNFTCSTQTPFDLFHFSFIPKQFAKSIYLNV